MAQFSEWTITEIVWEKEFAPSLWQPDNRGSINAIHAGFCVTRSGTQGFAGTKKKKKKKEKKNRYLMQFWYLSGCAVSYIGNQLVQT